MKFKIQGLRFKVLLFFSLITICYSLLPVSYAAHPLITDDTGTQGKGNFQIEVNSEFSTDEERVFDEDTGEAVTGKTTGGEVASILSYGLTDDIDVVLGVPYVWAKTEIDGDVDSDEDGISDISIELKWRLHEKDGLGFALKPAVILPTGDEEKGLGNGKASYGLMFITTKEIEPWAFHLNLGYMHNEYKLEEDMAANRKGIWHASLATQAEVLKDLTAVANVGVETNPDKKSNTHPAFLLGGVIYSIKENLDIDAGIKAGLNKPETDLTLLAGMAMRF